jgi:lipopolysaccharide/colanic/teichoic acid biosynthesis glycosyltransferase
MTHPSLLRENQVSASPSVVFPKDTPFFRMKMLVDRVLALLLLIPGLPLIALLIAAVRFESKGTGIYRQLRVGHCGKLFTLYKIRSMTSDAESALGPTWAGVDGDSRVTKLGYWLRKLHLDELPQLWNVVRGEMSLVGPRPERPEFVRPLAEQIPGYLDRLRIPPGITGLAQVNLPADTDLDSVRRKLVLDLEYLDTADVGLDLRILLCTLGRVFGLRGGRAVALFGLQRNVTLPTTTYRLDGAESGPKAQRRPVLN